MATKWIKNKTAEEKTYQGRPIPAGEFFEIGANLQAEYAYDVSVLMAILNGELVCSRNGVSEMTEVPGVQITFLQSDIPSEVTTQYEKNDKDLKMAKAKATITNGVGRIALVVPGSMQAGEGRYVAGGYAIMDSYDADDYVKVTVEDVNRVVAWMIALAMNPEATEPVADEVVRSMGVIEGFGKAFPQYPTIKSYTDDECPEENQGWFFWPTALGGSREPVGEADVEPIGGYGFLPSEFALVLDIFRPNVQTGTCRVCFFWGKESLV